MGIELRQRSAGGAGEGDRRIEIFSDVAETALIIAKIGNGLNDLKTAKTVMEIGLFVFPGFQLLDLSGPLAAFEIAQRFHGAAGYHPRVVSLAGGLVPSSSGVELNSEKIGRKKFDTLLVVGGDEMAAPCGCGRTRRSLRSAAEKARRVASICTGAYLLAETGLLDGRRVTTHWRFAPELLRKHPTLRVETDRIYVRDGRFWSSAGITAGIDLSLALIGDDFGEEVARKVAQDLVVFHRRPGGQSQYSALLELDAQSERIGLVMSYARENLTADLSVEALAERAHLSPRQFARVFAEETGRTPAKAVEQLRLEAARVRVEENLSESLEEIAMAVGFADPERMRRAFIRVLGQPPQGLRRTARQQSGVAGAIRRRGDTSPERGRSSQRRAAGSEAHNPGTG